MATSTAKGSNLKFYNNEEIYDVVIVVDGKKTIKANFVFLSSCQSLLHRFKKSANWKDSSDTVIKVNTSDFIKYEHYYTFFKLAHVDPNDFSKYLEEIYKSIVQYHYLAQEYQFVELEEYTCYIIMNFVSIDVIKDITYYLFHVIPDECSEITKKTKLYVKAFIKACLSQLKIQNDVMYLALLASMPFELLKEILESPDTHLSFLTRMITYDNYLSLCSDNETENMESQSISYYQRQSAKVYLKHKLKQRYFLDQESYFIHSAYDVAISRINKLVKSESSFGITKTWTMAAQDGRFDNIVLEKLVCISFSEESMKTMLSNKYSQNSITFASSDIKLFIPDPGRAGDVEAELMNYFLAIMRIRFSVHNGNVNIDYSVSCEKYRYFGMNCKLERYIHLLGGSVQEKSTETITVESDEPKQSLFSNLDIKPQLVLTKNSIFGCKTTDRNSFVIPMRLVFYVRDITIRC
jgi:hypothetical protein